MLMCGGSHGWKLGLVASRLHCRTHMGSICDPNPAPITVIGGHQYVGPTWSPWTASSFIQLGPNTPANIAHLGEFEVGMGSE